MYNQFSLYSQFPAILNNPQVVAVVAVAALEEADGQITGPRELPQHAQRALRRQ
jgi:hypothetical protein